MAALRSLPRRILVLLLAPAAVSSGALADAAGAPDDADGSAADTIDAPSDAGVADVRERRPSTLGPDVPEVPTEPRRRPRLTRFRVLLGGTLAAAFLLIVAVLAAATGVGGLLTKPSVSVFEVGRGRFVREVGAAGVLKAVKATPILVPIDIPNQQKVAWLAKEGSAVKIGDPVVVFDPTDMGKDLADGRSDRDAASSKIVKTRAENTKSEKTLSIERDVAREELAGAEDLAPKSTEIFSRNEIVESEIDRDLLAKRTAAAEKKLVATGKLGAADLALGEIERSKADIKIRQAEKGLGAMNVLAPHDGLIVLERNWRGETIGIGETVWPGQKVGEIPDLSALEAKVFVLEADAGGLEPGRSARVTIEGKPGTEYPAKVSRVDAVAKTKDWRSPTKYFETILSFEKTAQGVMKPGQAVRARILLEEADGAIAIPRSAIFDKDGKRVVYRESGGRFEPVEVTIGHNSLARVVIAKGLEAGDRIALRDPTRSASEIFRGEAGGGAAKNGAGGGASK